MTKKENSTQAAKTLLIGCLCTGKAFTINHKFSMFLSQKLSEGYKVTLEPILKTNNLKGNVYDSMIVQERIQEELDTMFDNTPSTND